MEKLLDFLQEFYGENRKFSEENWLLTMTNWVENLSGAYAQTYIISKQGWFIQWLVENEKIDEKELEKSDRPFDVGYATEETFYERVLMLLSIQDEPISFILSILK